MNKIILIIKREYLTRVKKKSFIVMTIIGPILMAAVMIVPIWISTKTDEVKTIGVIDETHLFSGRFTENNTIKFVYLNEDLKTAKENFGKKNLYAIWNIPVTSDFVPRQSLLYSDKKISWLVESYVEEQFKKQVSELYLLQSGVSNTTLELSQAKVRIISKKWNEDGRITDSSSGVATAISYFAGILIYFFIFLYGSQVMRGVIEEKTSRIIEVMVSSVKPFQLMMGKIIGIAAVGLTQFLLWVVLTGAIIGGAGMFYSGKILEHQSERTKVMQNNDLIPANNNNAAQIFKQNEVLLNINETLADINFSTMIIAFLFYFLFGYLIYAALFAAIGAAVDNEADTQQFMLPITVPLILSIVMMNFFIANPQSSVAVWFSMIPFTSPITMMVRIPFGVNILTELLPSMIILIVSFLVVTWFAAKIYRTGILMYGKKPSYKELMKWLKY